MLNFVCTTLLPNLYMFTHIIPVSIPVVNSVDPDQMALLEAGWSESTVFSWKDKSGFSWARVKIFQPKIAKQWILSTNEKNLNNSYCNCNDNYRWETYHCSSNVFYFISGQKPLLLWMCSIVPPHIDLLVCVQVYVIATYSFRKNI